jgi:hypothetical protein
MRKQENIEIICYLEGVRFPVRSVAMSSNPSSVPTLNVSIIATPETRLLKTKTIIQVFIKVNNNKPHLLFDGELINKTYRKVRGVTEVSLLAHDFRAVMNESPSVLLDNIVGTNKTPLAFGNIKQLVESAFQGYTAGELALASVKKASSLHIDFDAIGNSLYKYLSKFFKVAIGSDLTTAMDDANKAEFTVGEAMQRYAVEVNRLKLADGHIVVGSNIYEEFSKQKFMQDFIYKAHNSYKNAQSALLKQFMRPLNEIGLSYFTIPNPSKPASAIEINDILGDVATQARFDVNHDVLLETLRSFYEDYLEIENLLSRDPDSDLSQGDIILYNWASKLPVGDDGMIDFDAADAQAELDKLYKDIYKDEHQLSDEAFTSIWNLEGGLSTYSKYVIMPKLINQPPPSCNVIVADSSVDITASITDNRITRALTYFNWLDGLVPLYSTYPHTMLPLKEGMQEKTNKKDLWKINETFKMSTEEKLLGIRGLIDNNQKILGDMAAELNRKDEKEEPLELYQKALKQLTTFKFINLKYSGNSLQVVLPYYNPHIVAGLPCIVKDEGSGITYYGRVEQVDISLSQEGGSVATAVNISGAREISSILEIYKDNDHLITSPFLPSNRDFIYPIYKYLLGVLPISLIKEIHQGERDIIDMQSYLKYWLGDGQKILTEEAKLIPNNFHGVDDKYVESIDKLVGIDNPANAINMVAMDRKVYIKERVEPVKACINSINEKYSSGGMPI